MNAKEDAKRMQATPGMVAGLPDKLTSGAASVTDDIIASTLGTAAKYAQVRLCPCPLSISLPHTHTHTQTHTASHSQVKCFDFLSQSLSLSLTRNLKLPHTCD